MVIVSNSETINSVKIGVGVIIENNHQLLLGQRINSHGTMTWAPPGGHLEFGETPEQCAIREALEETGLQISNCQKGIWTNDYFSHENKHYITLFIHTKYHTSFGTPKIMEPNKCKIWQWFDWDSLPSPLFLPLKNLILDQKKQITSKPL